MPQIRVLLGFQQGQVFSLNDGVMVIGRDPKSGIVLHPDSAASRRHAEIFPVDGHWRVRDLGSVNGTALNGRRVKDEVLRDKDEVVIGDNVLVFEDKDPDAARIAEAASHVNPVESRDFQNRPEAQALVHAMAGRTKRIEAEVGRVSAGQPEAVREVVREVLVAIISQGHVLLDRGSECGEIVRAVAETIGLRFGQLEFTPESKVSDLTGSDDFPQVFLADAINRASLVTQAVLFEAMQDYRVNVAGQTRAIPQPFVVVAMQKPANSNGACPLSEALLDRFMFSIAPKPRANSQNGASAGPAKESRPFAAERVLTEKQVSELQRAARDLRVSDHVMKYAVRLVRATRPGDKRAPAFVKRLVHSGAGPRAAEGLILGAKARAIMDGRLLVSTDDIGRVAVSVLRHRIFMNFTAGVEDVSADQLVERLLAEGMEPSAQGS